MEAKQKGAEMPVFRVRLTHLPSLRFPFRLLVILLLLFLRLEETLYVLHVASGFLAFLSNVLVRWTEHADCTKMMGLKRDAPEMGCVLDVQRWFYGEAERMWSEVRTSTGAGGCLSGITMKQNGMPDSIWMSSLFKLVSWEFHFKDLRVGVLRFDGKLHFKIAWIVIFRYNTAGKQYASSRTFQLDYIIISWRARLYYMQQHFYFSGHTYYFYDTPLTRWLKCLYMLMLGRDGFLGRDF